MNNIIALLAAGLVIGLVLAVFLGALVTPLHRRRVPSIAEIETNGPVIGKALADVWNERARQMSYEGYTPAHDDEHVNYELARAATCYVHHAAGNDGYRAAIPEGDTIVRALWPWDCAFKPKTRRADLVRAGALIVAEIERLDRAAAKAPSA